MPYIVLTRDSNAAGQRILYPQHFFWGSTGLALAVAIIVHEYNPALVPAVAGAAGGGVVALAHRDVFTALDGFASGQIKGCDQLVGCGRQTIVLDERLEAGNGAGEKNDGNCNDDH